MIGEQYLLPRSTPLPEQIIRAMSRSMINHRGPAFHDLLFEVTKAFGLYIKRKGGLDIPLSGTRMEAAVANFIAPETMFWPFPSAFSGTDLPISLKPLGLWWKRFRTLGKGC